MDAGNTGKFKHSTIKRNARQLKKHVTQMNSYEIQKIIGNIYSLRNLHMGNHLLDKFANDGLNFKPQMIVDVLRSVKESNVVEYNLTQTLTKVDRRVLLRSSMAYPVDIDKHGEVMCNFCFVLSLDSGQIVTAYWNEEADQHNTIDWKRYTPSLSVR